MNPGYLQWFLGPRVFEGERREARWWVLDMECLIPKISGDKPELTPKTPLASHTSNKLKAAYPVVWKWFLTTIVWNGSSGGVWRIFLSVFRTRKHWFRSKALTFRPHNATAPSPSDSKATWSGRMAGNEVAGVGAASQHSFGGFAAVVGFVCGGANRGGYDG